MDRFRRFGPTSRAALLAFLLLTLANAFVLLFPSDASAACWYPLTYRLNYYSEPELINKVGECYRACSGSTTCWGTQTSHVQNTNMSVCPAQCQ